ncbi:hypothetical protein AB0E96_01350 [Kitasatospora sp. NPDC036755]|uniref:hypothetical protein n=1 Tax=Kitasatospora sp. NPDC036755 TaxID=3154600 RepID=UPI0033ED6F44
MPGAPRTATERLDRLNAALSGTRAHSRADNRMRMNRPGNILFGVLLHAAARLDQGLPLTDLEQRLITQAGKYMPAQELPAFGRAYREAVARGSIAVLPQAITDVPVEKGFSSADLTAALPALTQEINAQDNVRVVDISKLGKDEPVDNDDYTAAMARYGRGITILNAPRQESDTQSLLDVHIRMYRFTATRESSGEAGSDEIYWGVSAGSDTTARRSFKTREYGSVDTGETHQFDYAYRKETYVFSGTVDRHLSTEFECWEADSSPGSFYSKLIEALSDFSEHAADTSSEISQFYDNETRKAAAWAALLAVGAGLLSSLLSLFINDDDLVLARSIGFSREYLMDLQRMEQDWWDFNGGDGGRHRLFLKFA